MTTAPFVPVSPQEIMCACSRSFTGLVLWYSWSTEVNVRSELK